MKRWLFPISAVVYVMVAVGCMLASSGQAETGWRARVRGVATNSKGERLAGLPMRGAAMQIQRIDWIETEYFKSIDEIAKLGCDSVLFVMDAHQENGSSSTIYMDLRLMPTPAQLGKLIEHAKEKGLRVMLMPIVLLDRPRKYTEWRGTIQPEKWEDWFESYRAMLYHFSWIAEAYGADVLVIGSELVSTEGQTAQWEETISTVRETFKGMLTYSANWDHYKEVTFWKWLDFASINSYYTLGQDSSVTVEQIKENWKPYKDKILNFQKDIDKPVLFTEVGWCSQANAAKEPWDYTKEEVPLDLDLQKRLWEAYFETWHGEPGLAGYMIWEWPPGDGGKKNRGYTPENKPAEEVIKSWLEKKAWEVK